MFSDRNNAVVRYVTPANDKQVSPGNSIACVCDGAAIGTQTYQPDAFVGTTNLKILHRAELNEYTGLFLVSALNAACMQRGYTYFDKRNDIAFSSEEIMLPATPDGEPDWAYMESYMRTVMDCEEVFAEHLASLMVETAGIVVDTSEWKEFRVGDLFECDTTKSIDKLLLDMSDIKQYPYIGRTSQNNGVLGFIDYQTFEPNQAGSFSVVQIGENVCFYQPTSWYATQNIFKLTPRFLFSFYVGLFLSSVITQQLKLVFGENAYANYPTKRTLHDLIILLPVVSDASPDWDYMDAYMRQIMEREETYATELERLL